MADTLFTACVNSKGVGVGVNIKTKNGVWFELKGIGFELKKGLWRPKGIKILNFYKFEIESTFRCLSFYQ